VGSVLIVDSQGFVYVPYPPKRCIGADSGWCGLCNNEELFVLCPVDLSWAGWGWSVKCFILIGRILECGVEEECV